MNLELSAVELISSIVTLLTIGIYIGTFKFFFVKKNECSENHDCIQDDLKEIQNEFKESVKRINSRVDNLFTKLEEQNRFMIENFTK